MDKKQADPPKIMRYYLTPIKTVTMKSQKILCSTVGKPRGRIWTTVPGSTPCHSSLESPCEHPDVYHQGKGCPGAVMSMQLGKQRISAVSTTLCQGMWRRVMRKRFPNQWKIAQPCASLHTVCLIQGCRGITASTQHWWRCPVVHPLRKTPQQLLSMKTEFPHNSAILGLLR